MILFYQLKIRLADILQAPAFCNRLDGLAHHLYAVQAVFNFVFVCRQANHHFGSAFGNHGQQAIIGTEYILILVKGQQQVSRFMVKKVHQHNMKSERRKVFDGIAADIGRLDVIKRRQLVGNICNAECWVYL